MAGSAKKSFDKTLDRVIGLLRLHEPLHGTPGRPQQHVSDLLRSALVLAMAALDALVLDRVSEAIPTLAKRGALGSTVAKWAKDEPDRLVGFFAEDNPQQALAELCRDQLATQTFQKADAIEGVLRDVILAEPPWERAARALIESWEEPLTAQDVKNLLDEYVERRNRIVHAGDVMPGQTATKPIRLDYVTDGVTLVEAVGEAVSASVTARLRAAS